MLSQITGKKILKRISKISEPNVYGILFVLCFIAVSGSGLGSAQSQTITSSDHSNLSPATQAARKFQKSESSWTITPVATEPLLENPVAIDVDPSGSIYVAETHRFNVSVRDITQNTHWLNADLGLRSVAQRENFLEVAFGDEKDLLTRDSEILRKISDKDGDGIYDSSVVFADGFNRAGSGIAAGVLAGNDRVYFASIPELWSFGVDSFDATQPADTQILSEGYGVHIGVTGHDLHGLAFGPDGRLYFSAGDRGFRVLTREGNLLNSPDTGGVLRCEPDGSNLEIFATGMRNPQELAFDSLGNLFTGDNDTGGSDQSRLLYVVQDGDYGWRCSYQHQVGFGPWIKENVWQGRIDGTLPTSGYVAQGPSGLCYYPGVGLPEKYTNTFFHCDFPGGVWNFSVQAKGAGFELKSKSKFLWDLWPTDVTFGPEGSIYIADWISGWVMPDRGRIYRMEPDEGFLSTNPEVGELKKSTQSLLKDSWPIESSFVADAIERLDHPDQRVRAKARQWIATNIHQYCVWTGFSEATAKGKINGLLSHVEWIWTAWQIGWRNPAQLEAVAKLLAPDLHHQDSEIRAQAARVFGDLKIASNRTELENLWSDPDPRVRFFAGMALSRVGSESSISPTLEALKRNADIDPYLTHAGVMALVRSAEIDQLVEALQTENDLSTPQRRAILLALRRLQSPEVARFLTDPDPSLQYEAARAIYDTPIPAAYASLAETLNHSQSAALSASRAIEANARIGDATSAERLIDWALVADPTTIADVQWLTSKAAAIQALTRWGTPSHIDPIMGLWRPYNYSPDRTPSTVSSLLAQKLPAHPLSQMNPKLAEAWVETLTQLPLKNLSDWLEEGSDNQAPEVQIAVLNAAMDWQTAHAHNLLIQSLTSKNKSIQTAALNWLNPDLFPGAVALLQKLILTEDGELNKSTPAAMGQAAIRKLAELSANHEQAMKVFQSISELAVSNKLRADWELDWLTGLDLLLGTNSATSLNSYREKYNSSESNKQNLRFLAGGNIEIGKALFFNKQEISCSRCHKVESNGGVVGPELDSVASRISAPQILQSILEPNTTIAEGYESTLITTDTGDFYSGILKEETPEQITLENLDQGRISIDVADISERERGPSAMPDGLEQFLTPAELRDLMAYLLSLKE